MFSQIIKYSIHNRIVILLFTIVLVLVGIYSMREITIEAVPDITNNQVQVITTAPSLATLEVEQFITTPIELAMQNIQQLEEIRSISRFGLSVVTIVFKESMDIYLARQLVGELLNTAKENLPSVANSPELAPISTGLGEIYQYVVRPQEGYEEKYSLTDLRTIQDWIVKRRLIGIEGVVEVNTLGGYLKQYEVAFDPDHLMAMNVTLNELYDALSLSNENAGGAYIEKTPYTYYIRMQGLAKTFEDIGNIVVKNSERVPVLVRDVATVGEGKSPRYGAATMNGKEVVTGTVMMLKGATSAKVTKQVEERLNDIRESLPEGVIVEPYLVRSKLISTAIGTVRNNLIEGGLIVVFILVLVLGNWRAGLIVASVIPLSMLFALTVMNILGISANLMSLGAIDFGLIVDGAVIIVEAIIHHLQKECAHRKLTREEMDREVFTVSSRVRKAAAFGEIIILIVYLPILVLVGIEGKMFRPMAQTVMLAIAGALILSMTYVPAMSAFFLRNKTDIKKRSIADRFMQVAEQAYRPVLSLALKYKRATILGAVGLFSISLMIFISLGGEFIPTLEEGDFAVQQILSPGSSISQSVEVSKLVSQRLKEEFPEVIDVIAKIGSAEIPTDPMPIEIADIIVTLKPKEEWTSAPDRLTMFERMERSLRTIPGVNYTFSQPIQLRFNELITGTRADIAVKIYGEDRDILFAKAKEAERVIQQIEGVGTIKVEQTVGMPQIVVSYHYDKLAQYGLKVKEVNRMVSTAFAGEKAGVIYEGERRFDLVVRMDSKLRKHMENLKNLYIPLEDGSSVFLASVAEVQLVNAPMQISRENTKRRITIEISVGSGDVQTLVEAIDARLTERVKLPPGYFFELGGQFENLQAAKGRLMVAVPVALGLILILLYFTFSSFSKSILIFSAIPFSAIGGIWALLIRGMPFSVSAGIGFVTLFGVSVLDGIVLVSCFDHLKRSGMYDIRQRIIEGTNIRLRAVLITSLVASLGFMPMALSSSGGAEVQRPLATVVIGGLVSATFLTLIVLPILYGWHARWEERRRKNPMKATRAVMLLIPFLLFGVSISTFGQSRSITAQEAVHLALQNHPFVKQSQLEVQQEQRLQNMRYNLGTTDFSYTGDGLDHPKLIHEVRVNQNIPNPADVGLQNKWQNKKAEMSLLQHEFNERALTLEVLRVYYRLQSEKELLSFFERMDKNFSNYYSIAQKHFEAGEVGQIERLSIKTQANAYRIYYEQAMQRVEALEKELCLLSGKSERITTIDTLEVLLFVPVSKSEFLTTRIAQQNTAIEEAAIGVLKKRRKPSFSVGYGWKNYEDDGRLHKLSVGVQVPLFTGQVRQQMEAQRLKVAASGAAYEAERLRVRQQQERLISSIQEHRVAIDYYQKEKKAINDQLEQLFTLNYGAGTVSYLELLSLFEIIAKDYQDYCQTVWEHNQAILQYQFISN